MMQHIAGGFELVFWFWVWRLFEGGEGQGGHKPSATRRAAARHLS